MSTQATYLKDYQPPHILIPQIDLKFEIFEDKTLVHSKITYQRNPKNKQSWSGVTLNGEKLSIQKISISGIETKNFEYFDDILKLPQAPESGTIEAVVQLEPHKNFSGAGLYKAGESYLTQCEAESFRTITFFLDRPDVLSRYNVVIEADEKKCPYLLSNGNLLSSQKLAHGRHQTTWQDPFPKPCYLFALVAGNLGLIEDKFKTMSGQEVLLQIYAPHGTQERCRYAMEALKLSMRWDEEKFGREYDLNRFMIVATHEFNSGAMENKGLNIFNSAYVLADAESGRDHDFDGILSVVGHEYFHNWTGNRVTCRDWFQLSLKEGLTVYRDQNFSMDLVSSVKRIEDVIRLRSAQFAEDAGPMAHPVRPASYITIDNFYTLTVYEKGAEVIRMMETIIGKANFRKGMDLYFDRHDGSAATVDDFAQAMQDASQKDLTQFKLWYSQAGTPTVRLKTHFDAVKKTWTLSYEQSCPETPDKIEKRPMHIPLRMNLLDKNGKELLGTESPVLDLTEKSGSFTFENISEVPTPSFLRGFSAPIHLEYDYSDADLYFLAEHDRDAFARWEAIQKLGVKTCLEAYEHLRNEKSYSVNKRFLELFGRIATENHEDLSYLAFLMGLPGEDYLGLKIADLHPDVLHKAREHVSFQIAQHNEKAFLSQYQMLQKKETGEITVLAAARRALKGKLLAYLGRLQNADYRSLAVAQFNSSKCMSDSGSAMHALDFYPNAEREQLSAKFFEKWKNDRLVINQWFSIQSSSNLPGALERIKEITKNPAFDKKVPNHLYTLFRNFGNSNAMEFHTAKGYAFLADQVMDIDKDNPQVAARIVSSFNIMKRLEPKRRGLIELELKRVLAMPGLSNNVFEIVSRALA